MFDFTIWGYAHWGSNQHGEEGFEGKPRCGFDSMGIGDVGAAAQEDMHVVVDIMMGRALSNTDHRVRESHISKVIPLGFRVAPVHNQSPS